MKALPLGLTYGVEEHTPGHVDCPVCVGARFVQSRLLNKDMLFREAFDVWMERRTLPLNDVITTSRYLSRNSLQDYRACGIALSRFFGKTPLGKIQVGHMQEYQGARTVCDLSACIGGSGHWTKPIGAKRLRKEIDMLIRILKAAKLWGEEQAEDFVRVQAVESDVPRVLETFEQERFLRTAASREDWHFVLWYANVGLQTAAATNELRGLQLGDITLGVPGFECIRIRSRIAKNRHRIRTIPLAGPAVWAMQHLVDRAQSLGAAQPHHFLFPLQTARTYYDPCRPMSNSGLKKRWDEVRKAAGIPWLRPYDLRHTGITRMAEASVPIDVAMDLVGHMTMAMHRHYTTISSGAKRYWIQALYAPEQLTAPPPPGKLHKKPPGRVNQASTQFPQKTSRAS